MAKTKSTKKAGAEKTNVAVEAASTAIPAAAAPQAEIKKTAAKPAAKKSSIVRSEPRANLLPINLEDEIRRLAYLLSGRRGFAPGHEAEDWLNAEHEVQQRYDQHSA